MFYKHFLCVLIFIDFILNILSLAHYDTCVIVEKNPVCLQISLKKSLKLANAVKFYIIACTPHILVSIKLKLSDEFYRHLIRYT